MMLNERLGGILLREGIIDSKKLDFCLNIQRNNGGERIGRVLKHYDFVNEEQITRALGKQSGWPVFTGEFIPDDHAISLLGLHFIRERMVFPARTSDGACLFVVSRVDDMVTTDAIEACFQEKPRFSVAPEHRLRQAIEKFILEQDVAADAHAPAAADNLVAWFDRQLNRAVMMGATDIHIEPSQKAVEMRFRIDGILSFVDSMKLGQLPRLVNIIFHRANVTVSDFGHAHDARFSHKYLNRLVDIRVSHIPAVHGSSMVLRLLDKNKAAIDLTALGYGQEQWDLIQDGLLRPEGMTLVVGPTGCGKTTTLYAMLSHMKSIARKIVTIEDPVEMHLPLMTQVQINDKRDISFGSAVRAFLRHDPNIVLIGEIRDGETAQEAMRAAMTGHKVFATLHANRPLDALLRLNDLGVPFMHMAGNVHMVVTQRLVRCLCPSCKVKCGLEAKTYRKQEQKYIMPGTSATFKAGGCPQCHGGYRGRTVVSEVLTIDEEREGLLAEGNMAGLRRTLASRQGYRTMFADGARLAGEGATSLAEMVRVLG